MNTKTLLSNILKIIVFAGIGFTLLYLLYQRQEKAYQAYCVEEGIAPENCDFLGKIIADFQGADYWWIGLVLVLYFISNVSRTARWFMLIQPLGYRPKWANGFFTIMLGYFANLGFPRIGEVVRAGTFARYEKIPVDKVMGTVVMDRLADAATLLTLIGLAFLLSFNDITNAIRQAQSANAADEAGGLPWVLIGVAALGILGVLLLLLFWQRLKQLALFQRIRSFLEGLKEGILTISKLERPFLFLFHSINIWLMYFLMTYVAFFAFEPTAHLGIIAGLVVFVFGALGIVVPSPGGMGAYQGLVVTALVFIYQINSAEAFSFANILFFSVQIGANVLFGLLALIVLPLLNRE